MTRPNHPYQNGLQGFRGVLYLPNNVDGIGAGLGGVWTVGGGATVSHPATTNTNLFTQRRRTRFANPGAGANQTLGIKNPAAESFVTTSAQTLGVGGFYFSCHFSMDAWPSDAGRLFVGLAAIAAGTLGGSDVVPNDVVGLWHDTADGQDILSFVSNAAGGAVKTPVFTPFTVALCSTSGASTTLTTSNSFSIPNSVLSNYYITGAGVTRGTFVKSRESATSLTMSAAMTVAPGTTLTFTPIFLAPGSGFHFEMWAYPNMTSTINANCRLTNENLGTKIAWVAIGNPPNPVTPLAPQIHVSNGAVAAAANDWSIAVSSLYLSSGTPGTGP